MNAFKNVSRKVVISAIGSAIKHSVDWHGNRVQRNNEMAERGQAISLQSYCYRTVPIVRLSNNTLLLSQTICIHNYFIDYFIFVRFRYLFTFIFFFRFLYLLFIFIPCRTVNSNSLHPHV